jgi:hypothetical protein
MSSMQINAFFSDDDIQCILNLPEVINAKDRLLQTNGYIVHTKKQQNHNNVVAFTIPNTSSITETIRSKWNIDLDNVQNIPMRWIKGDTASHIDTPLFKLKTNFASQRNIILPEKSRFSRNAMKEVIRAANAQIIVKTKTK